VLKHSFHIAVCLLSASGLLQASTLEQLSMSDLAVQSHAIVRARVTSTYAANTGGIVYTHYRLQISETYKGSAANVTDIAVPGGTAGAIRQVFSGAPQLTTGAEYVLFLWTSRSGITQIMGFTQGVFSVGSDSAPDPTVTRSPSAEMMLSHATGRPVKDRVLSLRLSDLKSQILAALPSSGGTK
jgi:hypothetical protein